MAAAGGVMFFGGRPLTTPQKRIAGSSKMAAAGGSVFWGGRPLGENGAAAAGRHKEETGMIVSFFFNNKWIYKDGFFLMKKMS